MECICASHRAWRTSLPVTSFADSFRYKAVARLLEVLLSFWAIQVCANRVDWILAFECEPDSLHFPYDVTDTERPLRRRLLDGLSHAQPIWIPWRPSGPAANRSRSKSLSGRHRPRLRCTQDLIQFSESAPKLVALVTELTLKFCKLFYEISLCHMGLKVTEWMPANQCLFKILFICELLVDQQIPEQQFASASRSAELLPESG